MDLIVVSKRTAAVHCSRSTSVSCRSKRTPHAVRASLKIYNIILFILCLVKKYDAQVVKIEGDTRTFVPHQTFPQCHHGRGITDTLYNKHRTLCRAGCTKIENLLHKLRTAIVVYIKEIDGHARFEKQLGKVGSRRIIGSLLGRFQVKGRGRQAPGIDYRNRLAIIDHTKQQPFHLARFIVPTAIFLPGLLFLGDKQLVVFIIRCTFVDYIGNEIEGKRRMYPVATPVSEAAMVSVAVGYAMCGGGVIVDMMFSDFMARAGDEIFNQLAKWQAIGGGLLQMPVVLRVMVGNKYGTQHSQEWTGLVGHIPGLKVVYPVTPYDAKGLLNAALKGSDPVVFFESQKLYNMGERFCEVPREAYDVALGKPALRREGRDITILTVGASLYPALESAEMLSRQGIEAEVIDARSIVPFDYDPVVKSVNKTGRLLIAGESVTQGSILNEFAVQLTAACFAALKAPPKVLGARNTVAPPCEYADDYYPTAKSIAAQVLELTKCPSASDRSVGRKNQKTARR